MQGFIYLHRKFLEWEWYTDLNTKSLFIHCLIKANYTDKKWKGIDIKRGQFITSYEILSKELNLSIQKIRTSINKLITTSEITRISTNKYTILTVCKYDDYQTYGNECNKQKPSIETNNQQTNNKQITTTNNDNKENNDNKKNKIKVSFRDSEFYEIDKLKSEINEKYHEYDLDYYHESMLNWSDANGEKKIDWLAVCRTWINKDKREGKAVLKNSNSQTNMVF